MTLQFLLEDEGFEVLLAGDGQRALELARDERPDVLLLDHHMPKMEGTAVIEALAADHGPLPRGVFILSGEVRLAGALVPGTEFILKPFDADDLVRRIRAALGD